jgi:signal transduction histidine kinase
MIIFYLYKTKQIRERGEQMERLVEKRTIEVKHQKEEIELINTILVEQKNELEAQTEELQAQAEELYNYTEALENSNTEVQKQRDDLSAAYEELNKYRNQLEELVMERTRDLIAAKEKAEESDSLKSAFLANMSHEIRTPLNAIIGFAKLLNSSNFNEKEKIDFTNIVEQNTNYLLNLVDDILDISKIESGIIKINFMPTTINEVLRDIDLIYAEEVKKLELKNISIQFKTRIAPDITTLKIETDPVRLRQVITNLINNALKYTKTGYVEFGCQLSDNNMLLYYVKDTGTGIKKENLEYIFERFRKFDDNSDEIVRGTGLGLAIVKQLVQLMKGVIWVESEYGKGSTFYFTLPVIYQKN